MINCEWFDNETCDNCGREHQPHCVEITFDFGDEPAVTAPDFTAMLCSDCIEDLKKRLS